MIILGLTGSIGMGKSTAAEMLRRMGVAVHDSDAVVNEALAPHGHAIPQVARAFPEAHDRADGTIDRKVLGRIVFQDEVQRKHLEGILHPLVWESQQTFLAAQRQTGAPVVVFDVPLLFETGAAKRVDKIIVVSAPAFIQRRRVLARPGMSVERFQGILASQMPDKEKRARADYVVPTGLGRAVTWRSLQKIVEGLGHERKQEDLPEDLQEKDPEEARAGEH